MIRIDLLRRQRLQLSPGLLGRVGLICATGLVLAGLYWADQRYPLYRVWTDLFASDAEEDLAVDVAGDRTEPVADEEKVVEVPVREVPVREVPVREVPVREVPVREVPVREVPVREVPVREEVVRRPTNQAIVEELESFAVREVPAGEEVEKPPPIAAPGRRRALQWSPACVQALLLCGHIPSSVRFVALTSNAAGEYVIEGLSASPEAALEAFLDTLKKGSQVELTVWREGRMQTEKTYKFTFQGQFDRLELQQLKPLSVAEAKSLFREVSVWARQSGLDSLSMEAPIQMFLAPELVQQRQKMWARGSYRQISMFVKTLRQVQETATLGELVVIPVYQGDKNWHKAYFYTAVDVLVQALP